ncbi:MAG: acyl-CoA/acyl-ACP dehydrogenase [Spirochaetes bacterium]|nr:acyl-CoA/acyl-ACP dehydrogenase [Spirochaetota bacterium]
MNAIATTIITDEEQQSFNDLAGTFAENQLGEFIHDHEYPYRLDPANAIRGIGELGFLAVNLPSEHGGLGLAAGTLAEVLERISRVDAGLAGTLFANAAALEIISTAAVSFDCGGIYEVVSRDGALPLAFQAYASPCETSVPVTQEKDGGFLLSGRVDLVVAGTSARYAVIPARNGNGSYSYFLVDITGKEVKKSAPVVTIGMQSSMPVDMEFNGARAILIGEEGDGKALFDELCRRMSYPACGILLGIMRGSFGAALEYCAQRCQGGRMIIQWDDVRMKLAGMGTLLALAETSMQGLKAMFAAGEVQAGPSAVATAVQLGRIATEVTSEGIQVMGGNGYMKDYGQEKRMRDAKQAQALLGSSPLRKMEFIAPIIRETQDSLQ